MSDDRHAVHDQVADIRGFESSSEGFETAALHSDGNLGSRERESRARSAWRLVAGRRKSYLRNSTTTPATATSAPTTARHVRCSPWKRAAISMAKIG